MRRAGPALLMLLVALPAGAAPRKRHGAAVPFQPPAAEAPPAKPAITPAPYAGRLTLSGMPVRTDARPDCRAQCARARFTCEAADEDCATPWTQCVRTCGAGR